MRKLYITFILSLFILHLVSNVSVIGQEDCPDNLLHYWTFNNSESGNFNDQVGTLDATTVAATETVLGRIDSAQHFNGLSELNIPDNIDFDWGENASFTIEFWVNKSTSCPSTSGNNNNVILGRDDATTDLHWWVGISCSNPGKAHFTLLANDGNGLTLESKRGIIDGNWHLVSFVRDGSAQTNSIFIDGVLDTTASYTYTSDFFSVTQINVGWLNLGSKYHFEGTLDELAIYNSALEASDFSAHFNSGIGKAYCGNVVGNDTNNFNISVDFEEMTPHIGQSLTVYLKEGTENTSIDSVTIDSIDNADFNVTFENLTESGDYTVDFWADMNENGQYDVPPTDHAWRLDLGTVDSDTSVVFVHNTDFTDIFGSDTTGVDEFMVTLDFTGMTPHIGQKLTVYLNDIDSDESFDSVLVSPVESADFSVSFDSVPGGNYNLDFWADMNENDIYDVPPADHAWRIVISDLASDTTIEFAHNTDFTDIFESDTTTPDTVNYQLTLNFTGFEDNVGQDFVVFIEDPVSQVVIDSIVTSIDSADFTVVFDSVVVNNIYNIDFYTDVNGNGSYDIPPVDQAWRIELTNVVIDTTVVFVYDTNYTDIGIILVGVDDNTGEKGFSIYPNPVQDNMYINLLREASEISIYSVTGSLLVKKSVTKAEKVVNLDVSALKPGVYILRLQNKTGFEQQKFLKE